MTIAVTFLPRTAPAPLPPVAFIGGGNMASAIIGGLIQQGSAADSFEVVEPFEEARAKLSQSYGIVAKAEAGEALSRCEVVVWAVKPQTFAEAARPVREFADGALQLSVAAGIPSDSIARWLGTERVVRAMPNTPALVGKGMTGLFARAGVTGADRSLVGQLLAPTGELIWVDAEPALDAVTAMSGSGPAYVFYFIEAMTEAGVEMGLTPEQAQRLAIGTFTGASALAHSATEPPSVLRARVTSKGGTTYAAISALEEADVKAQFKTAIRAAQKRAAELGEEFGRD
ncbi:MULTISPECIES: pyrroline-5-carboxylate reductase [Variovorax]|uniref:Pyrroline-5-carboxylate reductase n=1 Tax=Variovorax paradoxus TaxID=34073 RepID=A0AA91IBK4_VARPD|nr:MULTISPECIES: pyrroline-5-carboxylate reductase [Variovorax]AVQ83133.1 pyrroline-5-carboxylate reductase [Variovorax sp. PMC12]OAK64718.1 pyrroline-5-carboxylate reductase [Variovorax paradoxus]QRY32571.1 pyrroline-5-carboxylate reductase [Variovorax sp. PDNC026]